MEKDTTVELTQLSFNESPTRFEKAALIPGFKSQMKPIRDFFLYVSLLLKKNYLIHKRSFRTTFFQMISPFLVGLMLLYWQYCADSISYQVDKEPPIYTFPKLSRCYYNRENPDDCITVAYAVVVRIFSK
jgi:hypothetical protein